MAAPKIKLQIRFLYQFLRLSLLLEKASHAKTENQKHQHSDRSTTATTHTMDAIPPPQSQATQQQKDCNMDSFPSTAAKAPTQAESPHQNPSLIQPIMNNNIPVDPSALITPIKVNEQQLKARKKQLQLQLAIVNHKSEDTPAPSGKESQRSKEAGGSSSAKPLKWPPVSSSKSLAPLAGRMADLMTTRGEKKGWGKRNTIEFEVNQECELI